MSGVQLLQELDIILGEDGEHLLKGQLLDGSGLEFSQSDLTGIEVHRRDTCTLDDVIQDIAASRGDGDHMVILL